jgi:hypothetical protein
MAISRKFHATQIRLLKKLLIYISSELARRQTNLGCGAARNNHCGQAEIPLDADALMSSITVAVKWQNDAGSAEMTNSIYRYQLGVGRQQRKNIYNHLANGRCTRMQPLPILGHLPFPVKSLPLPLAHRKRRCDNLHQYPC